jgi:predicted DNA binding CopG/RHH family protein
MSKPAIRYESTQEPLDDEERILMDPETWDWDSAQEAIVEPDGYSISEVRLSYDELSRIEQAATAKGMTVNAYLRYAAQRSALQHASN